jgi:LacI family transcriptional regulator
MKKKITIKDIAKVANVSIGTVDRVIHNRGKVSDNALKQVNKALKELNYKPNPMARSLKNNVVYSVAILVPDPKKDPYWVPCQIGITEIISEFEAFDVDFTVAFFDPSDPELFLLKGLEIIKSSPNAFLFVPLFERESDELLKAMRNADILSATFNSMLRNQVDYHVGQDLYLSGRVAAKLISDFLLPNSKICIVHIDEASNNAVHMRQKEEGFRSFFDGFDHKHTIYTQTVRTKDISLSLIPFIQKHAIMAFFITTSKAYEVANIVVEELKDPVIVGYDLLPNNIKGLLENKIKFLIHQAPKMQASLTLKGIVENLLFSKETSKTHFLPIEIVNSENVRSYQ